MKLYLSNLYQKLIQHKFVAICIVFTLLTVFESILIVSDLVPAKEGKGPYIHMIARFVLNACVIFSIYLYDCLTKVIRYKLVNYIIIYFVATSLVLGYVWVSGFYVELHPDAYIDMVISVTFMYLLYGVFILFHHFFKYKINK